MSGAPPRRAALPSEKRGSAGSGLVGIRAFSRRFHSQLSRGRKPPFTVHSQCIHSAFTVNPKNAKVFVDYPRPAPLSEILPKNTPGRVGACEHTRARTEIFTKSVAKF